MAERLTRQQIYDRIRASSKDSYILEEMKRLGFWESSDAPTLPEILIKREGELSGELNRLAEQNRKFSNREAMLKEMRKARMKKAKENRALTRQRNKEKKQKKAEAWKQLQNTQILYLGEGVSKGLNYTESDTELLKRFNLPVFNNVTELADCLQTDLSSLRYLLFQRKVSKINHYHVFEIPKKSGGVRRISAPKKRLKLLQHLVLENILNNIAIDGAAHGFVKQRSTVSNALPHVKQDIVINMDIKDFFPTITYARVKGLFHKSGYSEQIATMLALICTQAETSTIKIDGLIYYVQNGKRFLPQGSPASPAISNLIAYKLDRKMQGLATKFNFIYTRYADDLSFSCSKDNETNLAKLLYYAKKIVESEGFAVNSGKTCVMRKGGQRKVTGIVVNEKPNVERLMLRRFRALLHNIETKGWNNQKWGKAKYLINAIEGYISYVNMVNPDKSRQFSAQLKNIVEKHGYPIAEQTVAEIKPQQEKTPVPKPESERKEAPQQGDWWNIF
jgi:hypothetical protein